MAKLKEYLDEQSFADIYVRKRRHARERAEEKDKVNWTKNPAQFHKILQLATTLYKELQTLPQMSGSDDKVFDVKAKRIEDQCEKLTRAMTEKGKVRRA